VVVEAEEAKVFPGVSAKLSLIIFESHVARAAFFDAGGRRRRHGRATSGRRRRRRVQLLGGPAGPELLKQA